MDLLFFCCCFFFVCFSVLAFEFPPFFFLDTGRPMLLDERALQEITREEMERQREERLRAKTAPNARERRRNWDMNSIEIKTTAGDKRKVKAPGDVHDYFFKTC